MNCRIEFNARVCVCECARVRVYLCVRGYAFGERWKEKEEGREGKESG